MLNITSYSPHPTYVDMQTVYDISRIFIALLIVYLLNVFGPVVMRVNASMMLRVSFNSVIGRDRNRREVIYISSDDDDPLIDDPLIVPVPKEKGIFNVITHLRGFDRKKASKLLKRVRKLHRGVNGIIQDMLRAAPKRGLRLKDTHKYGLGIFTEKGVRKDGTPIAVYIAALSTMAQCELDGDNTYVFSYGRVENKMCVLDGAFFDKSNKKAINGVFVNHSCTPNSEAVWKRDKESGLWCIFIYPLSDNIPPKSWITIDYNGGDLSAYWQNEDDLAADAERYIVRCGCAFPHPCPERRAYDLREKVPSDYR
jgi:hypothetical protein